MPKSSTARRERFDCPKCGRRTDALIGTRRLEERLCRPCFGKRKDRRPRDLNELDGRSWAHASKSVEEYLDTRSQKQRSHGAAFPESLARQQVEIFTKRGQLVLDPFVGVGTTMDACANLGRRGIGIDLNQDFIDLARKDLAAHPNGPDQTLVVDDARRLGRHVRPSSVDLVLTSPPYGSLLKNVKGSFAYKWREHSTLNAIANPEPYSADPEDLGNLAYVEFLDAIGAVLSETLTALKPKGYAVWVIKDFRALKDGVPYVNLHGDVITQAQVAGFTLWDLRIYDQTRFRPLVCLGFPSSNFYLNIGHSYLLVFRKLP